MIFRMKIVIFIWKEDILLMETLFREMWLHVQQKNVVMQVME